MYRPIAAGVGGAGGRQALAWAIEYAEHDGAPLALVHVCFPGSPLDRTTSDPEPGDIDFLDPPLARALVSARARLGRRGAALKIRSGEPEDCLTGVSASARMLVIGDGEGGRTVRRVVRHAACPVVVVRPPSEAACSPFAGRVLAGVDGSPADRDVLEFAFRYAMQYRLPMVAAHVAVDGGGVAVLDSWVRRFPAVPVRTTTLTGSVPDALIRVAVGARLLVVGDKRRGIIGRVRTGDVPVTVATEAPCPVAVIQQQHGDGKSRP